MVAITVILAAVIGAFVLEIGNQQETAPSTSFDSNERVLWGDGYVDLSRGINRNYNVTEVEISHAGGDTIDVTQFDATVEGNDSVWGIEQMDAFGCCKRDSAAPAPDIRPTLGSNAKVEFSSGQTMSIVVSEGIADENVKNWKYGFQVLGYYAAPCDRQYFRLRNDQNADKPRALLLQQDDNVNVVWTAESGGKTQTLFKYTVQQSIPDC